MVYIAGSSADLGSVRDAMGFFQLGSDFRYER